jgi:hypothetical protein
MSRPNTREVIVIGDSDSDDNNLQPSASSVVLVDSIARIPPTANSNATSSRHPDTPRGKSEPTLCVAGLVPSAETRQRQTRSLPHNVIDVDADELSDGPPVSFQITAFVLNRMRPTNNYPAKAGQN